MKCCLTNLKWEGPESSELESKLLAAELCAKLDETKLEEETLEISRVKLLEAQMREKEEKLLAHKDNFNGVQSGIWARQRLRMHSCYSK